MRAPRKEIERLLVLAQIADHEERPEVEEADRLAIVRVRKWLQARVVKDACCKNEKRDFNGGCVNCGAPCL